jgi:putative PIN family toxin of toxin-antitoxin system
LSESGHAREKLRAVVDTSVFVAAIFWQGSARVCLTRFARREFEAMISEAILWEYSETAWELRIAEDLAQNPQPWLNWFSNRATITDPVILNEPVCADEDDEKFIECALSARASYVVSRDRHLLQLVKPFGIAIVDDREFLSVLRKRSGESSAMVPRRKTRPGA